jgi:hypothetical protein
METPRKTFKLVRVEEVVVYCFILLLLVSLVTGSLYLKSEFFILDRIDPFTRVWKYYNSDIYKPIAITLLSAISSILVCRLSTRTVNLRPKPLNLNVSRMLLVWIVGIFLTIIVKSDFILNSNYYLNFRIGGSFATIANIYLLCFGFFSGITRHKINRRLWILLSIVSALIIFAYGSRSLALFPVTYLFASTLIGVKNSKLKIGVFSLISIGLLPIPLILRNGSGHGLLPYLSKLSEIQFFEYGESLAGLIKNIGFSVAIIKYTSFDAPEISLQAILTSLNPLLSTSGWDELKPTLRAHLFIPYSGIGELYNFSPLLLYFFLFQLFCLVIITSKSFLISKDSEISTFALIHFGLSILACLYLLQYNLRSVFRLETILIVNYVIFRITNELRAKITEK